MPKVTIIMDGEKVDFNADSSMTVLKLLKKQSLYLWLC